MSVPQGGFLLLTYQNFTKDEDQFNVQITKVYNDFANAINVRQIGAFQNAEYLAGQFYFNPTTPQNVRNAFRVAVNFGALPNAAVKSVAHNIPNIDPGPGNSTFNFVHIYGAATNQTHGSFKAVPIPYVNDVTPTDGIEIWVDATNVNIRTTTANWVAFTAIITLEYLKN